MNPEKYDVLRFLSSTPIVTILHGEDIDCEHEGVAVKQLLSLSSAVMMDVEWSVSLFPSDVRSFD